MLGDERLQLRDEREVAGERELGVDPDFERCETQLVESVGLQACELLELQIGERRPSPELLRSTERARGGRGIAGRERLAAFGRKLLEALQVQLAGLDPKEIPGRTGDEAGLVER